jgi:hypothetical protein
MTPEQAKAVVDAASGVPQYELAILGIVGLSGLLSLFVSVTVALLWGKWRDMERTVRLMQAQVTEIDRLVVGEYVKRPELEKAIDRLVEAQREERKQVLDMLQAIQAGLQQKVDRQDCDRWHGMMKP